MALFSKPPAKKPEQAKPDPAAPKPRPVSAREVAAQAAGRHKPPASRNEPTGDISVTGSSLVDWSAAPSAIEVAQANPGLCAVLENAALMYASGQGAQARALLDDGVVNDDEAKTSPLAWLALFDLLQRANDRAAFDQLALQYVVQFERSAPAWDEGGAAVVAASAKQAPAGYVALTGQLSDGVATPLEGLRKAIDKRIPQARVDFSQLAGYDAGGARALSELLARARKQQMELSLQRMDKLVAWTEAAVKSGKEGGEAAWMLSLELLQWQHAHEKFEDRAVDFAVTFELSPPSWEPPPRVTEPVSAADAAATAAALAADAPAATEPRGREAQLAWSGVLAGSNLRALADLNDQALHRNLIAIDMTAVERIDFVCAGALLNTINRIEGQRKSVQITGISPIIRALLLLIGISPRHFVRKLA